MKNKKRPFLVTLAILSVATVFVWIVFSVIRRFQKPTPLKIDPRTIEPVTPTLDLQTLQELGQKFYFSDTDNIQTQLAAPKIIEEPEATATPVATQSAEVNTNLENATGSGNL